MVNNIRHTPIFEKLYKRYLKKYRSLKTDLSKLEALLMTNPKSGTCLGNGLYKIRLSVKSKNKGKSGGFRVINYLIEENNENIDIYMLIIYDKDEISNVSKEELLTILRENIN